MIRKENGKYVLYSMDGSKHLGTFNTMQEAHAREHEIEYFKHQDEMKKGTK